MNLLVDGLVDGFVVSTGELDLEYDGDDPGDISGNGD